MNKQIAPAEFGGPSDVAPPTDGMSAAQKKQIWSPIRTGGLVIAVFVVGLLIWAATFSISGGVPAPGFVAIQNNRKTVQHLDGGIIREIRVREGDRVTQGQVLMVFDDTQALASVDVMRNQYDSALAERARLEAELNPGTRAITWPAELLARRTDPRVIALMRDQESLFRASLSVYESQVGVLTQRAEQYRTRLDGLSSQITSLNSQSELINEELSGVSSLAERGFAPRSRVLALQRSAAALEGDRGARTAEVAGVREAIGESQIQLAQLRQQRTTVAAEALREVQVRVADVTPRLRAAEETLERTTVRSPAAGYVLGLTQFTDGGVAAAGARLLDIVPADVPLVIRARIRPDHIDEVRRGMTAQVRLTAFKARSTPSLMGRVVNVSADQLVPQQGPPYFEAELVIDPVELKKLPPQDVLAPGMPAMVTIVTGERSILNYLVSPLTDTLRDALHEP